MSIKSTSDDSTLTLVLDNGDRKGFLDIMQKWGFKDEQSLLKFAMSAMIINHGTSLIVTKENGEYQRVAPMDEHLLPK